ncbi:hypothetical protein DBB_11160 [Desulfoluna spongiiphila]|nr:hypothetical protein DBB_11160 [Desulfoluna spongiiphila]
MRRVIVVCFVCLFMTQSAFSMGTLTTWQDRYAEKNEATLKDGLGGWNVLSEDYRKPHILDGLSLEWDYFSIHDKNGKFTGVVAYLVADPEGHLGDPEYVLEPNLMPSGANMACFGKVGKTGSRYADYVNFGLDFEASSSERSFFATKPAEGTYGKMVPMRKGDGKPDRLILSGKTVHFEWELEVSQLWAGENSPEGFSYPDYHALKEKTWEVGHDLHLELERLEHWTVNMNWPSTKVDGWIRDLTTGERMQIDGHGYRENSFGRWAFALGGWDFFFMSDLENKVQFGFQTYHHGTEDLDYLDVDFLDNGTPKTVRFRADQGELGWHHASWAWSPEVFQCRPLDSSIIGINDEYTVAAYVDIGDNFAGLLSDVTWVTGAYQITTMFPMFSGTITRTGTEEVVAEFSGQGGGEFSLLKSPVEKNDPWCNRCMGTYNQDISEQ